MFDTVAQGAIDLAFSRLAFQSLALVVLRLAFAEAELDFGETLGEINLQRHEGHALGIEVAGQTVNLLLVEEESPWTEWINVVAVAEFVGIDVGVVQPALATLDAGEGVVN